jgi:DNA-binding LytR/AlgR family response regulator
MNEFPPNFTLEISRGHAIARHQINGWHRDSSGRLLVRLKTGEEFMVSKRLQKDVLQYLELLH